MSLAELEAIKGKLAVVRRRVTISATTFLICGSITSAMPLYVKIYSAVAFIMLGCSLLMAAALVPKIIHRPPFPMAYLAASCLIVSFLIGLDVGHHGFDGGQPTHSVTLKSGVLEGKVIRAGERGVLFYETSSKQVGLLLWDDISRLVTNKAEKAPAIATTPAPGVVAPPPKP
jgi:hypothetical protein